MIIVDMHRDIAYDAIDSDRDYRLSVAENRRREAGVNHPRRKGPAATGLPDALASRIGLVGATLFVEPTDFKPWGGMVAAEHSLSSYSNPQEAHDAAYRQLEYYIQLAASNPSVRIVENNADLNAVLATWGDGADPAKRLHGMVLLMEGADPVVEPAQFGTWWERSVRVLGTSWSKTRYAGGTQSPGPLTDLGRQLLKEMAKYNAVLDLSHMAEEACMESLETYPGPIIASHANPRWICNTDRHLTDEAIKLMGKRDAVMGLVLLNVFWKTDYKAGDSIPISRIVDAIDHICQLTGSNRNVGIGTDWYAGMGSDEYPDGLDTVADLWKIADELRGRGYSEADIDGITSGNMLRKLREGLPE